MGAGGLGLVVCSCADLSRGGLAGMGCDGQCVQVAPCHLLPVTESDDSSTSQKCRHTVFVLL